MNQRKFFTNSNQLKNNYNSCIICDQGTYADEEGLSNCKKCPAGTYNSCPGSDSISGCYKCSPGTYSNSGDAACTLCPDGEYNTEEGQSSCQSMKS